MRLVVVLALLLAPATAWPCPAGIEHCTKYDFLWKPVAQVYIRDVRGELPRRRANVMKHLTGAGWHAKAGEQAQRLQVFDGADVPDTYARDERALGVFVRGLEKVDHVWRVTLDDGVFEVMRCKELDKMRTCLVRVS